MTYYDVLGVPPSASSDEVKNAYRNMLKAFHPDNYSGDIDFAEEKTRQIVEAYSVLKNETTRAEYDESLYSDEQKNAEHQEAQDCIIEGLTKKLEALGLEKAKQRLWKAIFFVTSCFLTIACFCINDSLQSEKEISANASAQIESISSLFYEDIPSGEPNLASFWFAERHVAILTDTGEKYHAPGCSSLDKSSHILVLSVSGAEALGWEPCKNCHSDGILKMIKENTKDVPKIELN